VASGDGRTRVKLVKSSVPAQQKKQGSIFVKMVSNSAKNVPKVGRSYSGRAFDMQIDF
jgi:hypothetical protein